MATDSETPGALPSWMRPIVGKSPKMTVVRILVLIVVVVVAFKFVLAPIKVTGESMLPNYKDGQFKLVNRLAYRSKDPERSDVVAIMTTGESTLWLKRIVGLPGEKIHILNGIIFVDDQELDEPYVTDERRAWNYGPEMMAENEYFVVGDNRTFSSEEHDFGRAERRKLLGKVIR